MVRAQLKIGQHLACFWSNIQMTTGGMLLSHYLRFFFLNDIYLRFFRLQNNQPAQLELIVSILHHRLILGAGFVITQL